MGLLQDLAGPLSQQLSQLSTAAQIGLVFAALLTVVVSTNVASQILFRNSNEPPVVFYWFPVIGSTITYGIDPPKFFKKNRARVSS